MENIYYVYIYYDPRTNPPTPIYVGKGHDKRMYYHLTDCRNPILESKLNKIANTGLEPIIEQYISNISDKESIEIEIDLIKKYGRIDRNTGTLCNLTDGGEGSSGRICKDETRELFSKQRKGKKQTEKQYLANCNRIISDETKEKISKSQIGISRATEKSRQATINYNKNRIISDETRALWSSQRKGVVQTEEHKRKVVESRMLNFEHKKVICINTGKIYDSLNKAAADLNLRTTAIAAVARGDRKSHKGFMFKYII